MDNVGEHYRQVLIDKNLDQRTFDLKDSDWPAHVFNMFGIKGMDLIPWVDACLVSLLKLPEKLELCVRKETKNFPIEGHVHPTRDFITFLKTWLGAPTILKDRTAELGETLRIEDQWHAAPDTKEPRLVTLLICNYKEDVF